MRKDLLAPLIVLVGLTSMVAVADSTGALPDVLPPAAADSGDTGADTADTGADTADTGADTADTGADTAGTDTADPGGTDTSTGGDTAADTGDTAVPVKSAAQLAGEKGGFGCSAVPLGAAPGLGVLVGLAALGRRRRRI